MFLAVACTLVRVAMTSARTVIPWGNLLLTQLDDTHKVRLQLVPATRDELLQDCVARACTSTVTESDPVPAVFDNMHPLIMKDTTEKLWDLERLRVPWLSVVISGIIIPDPATILPRKLVAEDQNVAAPAELDARNI